MTIEKEITIEAPLEAVFAALTEPEQLVSWWGDGINRWESDVRVGGGWASYGTFSDRNAFVVKGTYRSVNAPAHIEMTVEHFGPQAWETTLRYDLRAAGAQTHLSVTHSGFTDEQFLRNHSDGWDHTLQRLQAFVTSKTAAC